MFRVLMSIMFTLVAGCASSEIVDRPNGETYLDLIVIEGGRSKYPDPLRSEAANGRPATLRDAVKALGKIVPTEGAADAGIQTACFVKPHLPLSATYQDCKYAVCGLLPQRSRIQDCGYFVRLEQWIQREWLGGLCLVEGPSEDLSLTRWFRKKGVDDCAAMSELIIVAYMQQLAGLHWDESQLILQSSK